MILDCEDNTLSFEKNYEFLGVAFRGIYCQKQWLVMLIESSLFCFCFFRLARQETVSFSVGCLR